MKIHPIIFVGNWILNKLLNKFNNDNDFVNILNDLNMFVAQANVFICFGRLVWAAYAFVLNTYYNALSQTEQI